MERNIKVLSEVKIRVVKDYLLGKRSTSQIAYQLQVSCNTVEHWIRKYRALGEDGLITRKVNSSYTPETKIQAITDYLNGKGSLNDICFRYNISSHSVLRKWIMKYNGHKKFKTHNIKGDGIMTTGRKTTYEERIKIVSYCIANGNDYNLTANEYKVSYQQVYGWIKKYEENGADALVDRRGKHKSFEELSESEKVSAQLKLLEAENRRLKMENDFLKKLKEIERR